MSQGEKPLKVLVVEDNSNDATLMILELTRHGYAPSWVRVENEEEYMKVLHGGWDLILSDYLMPSFEGVRALELWKEQKLAMPFIIVSGTIGEETAVAAMKQGATDYLIKDRLARLGLAVEHALDQARFKRERREVDAALRTSEERFVQLAETIQEVFWMMDGTLSRMLYVSPSFEKIWGRHCAELYASPDLWLKSVHTEDFPQLRGARERIQEGEPYDLEYRIRAPDGTDRWVHERAFPVRDGEGQVERVVGLSGDITERHRLREQLRQSQKVEAVGLLAGGIAHDFNNIISAMMVNLSLLDPDAVRSADEREIIIELEKLTDRAAKLTQQVLQFSRQQAMRAAPMEVNGAVGNLLNMLRRLIGENIQMEQVQEEPELWIQADPGMLDQALVNLCVNARDAMPNGGRLRIRCRSMEITEEEAQEILEARAGAFVRVSVEDCGCGMDAAVMKRLFEPFFTTKEIGKGTGLGLASVHGIMHQHLGWISAESSPGQGSIFHLFFPRHTEGRVSDLHPPAGRQETILLVEDETHLRNVCVLILEKFGYRTFSVGSAQEAYAQWEMHQGEIDLLLTDYMMADGLSGVQIAETLRSKKPSLRVIITSGHSQEALHDLPLDQEGYAFLQKPYNAKSLADSLRAAFDREPV